MKHLQFKATHWDDMAGHVARCSPEEACGLLAGTGEIVLAVFPVTNWLHNPFRFEMDPKEQLSVFNQIEESHLDLLGIYHSHPSGPSSPSETDIHSFSYPGVVSLIWFWSGETWSVNGFTIQVDSCFPIPLIFSGLSNPS